MAEPKSPSLSPRVSRRTSLAYALTGIAPRPCQKFSCDGSPLSLWSFLASSASCGDLRFQFRHSKKLQYYPLEDNVDRRIIGNKIRYDIVNGSFQISHPESQGWISEGRIDRPAQSDEGFFRQKSSRSALSEVYQIKLDPELVIHIGVVPGSKVPVVTDRNPHLEGLLDQRRIIYLPFTEDKNLFLELPNSPGLFFTTQRMNFGAEIVMLEDTTIHKNWIVLINEVFRGRTQKFGSKSSVLSRSEQEVLWQETMVENLIYCERILELLNRQGFKPEIKFRLAPEGIFAQGSGFGVPHEANLDCSGFEDDFRDDLKHEDATATSEAPRQLCVERSEKMCAYFKDELSTSRGKIKFYLYQNDCLLYGFHENGNWSFGIKDQGSKMNGKEIYNPNQTGSSSSTLPANARARKAEYPL